LFAVGESIQNSYEEEEKYGECKYTYSNTSTSNPMPYPSCYMSIYINMQPYYKPVCKTTSFLGIEDKVNFHFHMSFNKSKE